MSILTDLQNIVLPILPSSGDTKGMLVFATGFAGGYFYFAPYLGASDMIASALVGWAMARSANKLFNMESLASAIGAGNNILLGMLVPSLAPLAVMYVVAGYYPMVDLTSSLIVYGSYVLGAYAAQRAVASLASK